MTIVSTLGGAGVMAPAALIAVAGLTFRGRTSAAIWLFATIASGRIVVELLKLTTHRPRPALLDRLVDVTSLSFPSSHSAGSMLTGVAVVLALGLGRWGWTAAVGWSLTVGISRVLLGVHWPSDVLAGWGLGLLWPCVTSRWLPGAPPPSYDGRTPRAGL